MSPRRVPALLIALVLVASACGSEAAVAPAALETTSTTTTAAPTTSVAAPVSLPSTTTEPVDPYETFVAHIRHEVTVLEAYESPGGERAQFEFAITNPTYFGNELALMITDRTDDGEWLKVGIPVRPNGTEAWIPADDAEIESHRFRALVNLTDRSVTVWNGESVVVETEAVIGKPATPTPVGSFFVNDFVEKWETSAYGPNILSLSAFSEALETFGGGVPVIAIHGTNRPDLLGGEYSNGCVRVPNDVIKLLAETVPIGTPVDIVA